MGYARIFFSFFSRNNSSKRSLSGALFVIRLAMHIFPNIFPNKFKILSLKAWLWVFKTPGQQLDIKKYRRYGLPSRFRF